MKLRTQLILAFFLLAVVPLTGLSVYYYFSSINAYRKAVEEEAGSLAQEMGVRMDSVREDMNLRVGRLGSFPFRQLMDLRMSNSSPEESRVLMRQLMSEMGDSAALIDSLEFVPGAPRRPDTAVTPKSPEKPSKSTQPRVTRSYPAPPKPPPPPDPKKMAAAIESANRLILELQPLRQQLGQQNRDGTRTGESSALNQDLSIRVEEIRKSAEAFKSAVEKTAQEARRQQPRPGSQPPPGERRWDVTAGSSKEGQVTAHVRPSILYRNVLSRSRRHPDDIPFAIDADGKMHTAHPADEPKLASLDLMKSGEGVNTQTRQAARRDWVVVTRKEQDSNATFGVARPIRQGLVQIRYTAARNLGFGLGMVGLALIGILPLSRRMTRNLAVLTEGAEQLARGNLQTRVPVKTRDEFGRLAETFNRMALDLEEHEKHLIKQERLKNELEMGRRIQEELLPREPLKSALFEIQGVSIPALEVGGDFFNYFTLPGGEVALLVGDVSGKGIAAALLMANLQATLKARLPLGLGLADLAGRLDLEIAGSTPPEVYLTLFMAILDEKQGKLRYVNAGHNPQFLLYADGRVEQLESTGRPLGLLPGAPFEERTVSLKPGDSLFLYTDGLIEAENAAGEEFGMDRLCQTLMNLRGSGAANVLAVVEGQLREHRGGLEPYDDATLMVLKVAASETGAQAATALESRNMK